MSTPYKIAFEPATKGRAKLRLALVGPAGSGKTFTALKVGRSLVGPEGRIAVLDSEHGSASKYADLFAFDAHDLDEHDPRLYVQGIQTAEAAGYDLLVIDSVSHEWIGTGGALELVDQHSNKFGSGWKEVTPLHNQFVNAVVGAGLHVIVTVRAKMKYAAEEVEEHGRKRLVVTRLGLSPIQRDGFEYEMDVIGDLDADNLLTVTKTRCPALRGRTFPSPGEEFAAVLRDWLDGEKPDETLRRRFHALGTEVYGGGWDEKRHALVQHLTNGRTTSSSEITRSEMQRLVTGIEAKRDEARAAQGEATAASMIGGDGGPAETGQTVGQRIIAHAREIAAEARPPSPSEPASDDGLPFAPLADDGFLASETAPEDDGTGPDKGRS